MDFIYVPWLLHTFFLWYVTCESDNLVPYFGPLLGVGRKVQIWDCHLGLLLNVVLLWWCGSVLASCPMGYCFAGCYLLPCFVFTSTVFLKRKVLLACLQARPLQERCINDLWLFRLTWRTAWWTPIVGDECQIWFNSLLSLSCCWISRETLVRGFFLYPVHEWMKLNSFILDLECMNGSSWFAWVGKCAGIADQIKSSMFVSFLLAYYALHGCVVHICKWDGYGDGEMACM